MLKHLKIIHKILHIDRGHWHHANKLQRSHITEETRNLYLSEFRIFIELNQLGNISWSVWYFFLVQPELFWIFGVNEATMKFVLEIINLKISSDILSKSVLLEIFSSFILKILQASFSHLLGLNTKITWKGKNLLEVNLKKTEDGWILKQTKVNSFWMTLLLLSSFTCQRKKQNCNFEG